MRTTIVFILIFYITSCSVFSQEKFENKSDFPSLSGPYMGQKLPEMAPIIFAPGIVSVNGRYEYGISFSPELDEIYFSVEKDDEGTSVYFSKLKNENWSRPKKANFTNGKKNAEMEAFVSPNGKKIYFTAYDSMDVKIWYVNRLENSWSEAELLDLPVNNDIVFYSNAAANGDIYYTNYSNQKMYYALNKNNKYSEIHEIEIEYGGHGFIAPFQDFILFDAFKDNDNTKDRDIHVSFKRKDGTWTKSINLGYKVNSSFNETCPSISPDYKYLFFSRYNEDGGLSNIYWVSAKVIYNLKPDDI